MPSNVRTGLGPVLNTRPNQRPTDSISGLNRKELQMVPQVITENVTSSFFFVLEAV